MSANGHLAAVVQKAAGVVKSIFAELGEAKSPLALLCLMGLLLYGAPVVRVFAAASVVAGIVVAVFLKVIRNDGGSANDKPDDHDPNDHDPGSGSVREQLAQYDREMDEFWKEWKARK